MAVLASPRSNVMDGSFVLWAAAISIGRRRVILVTHAFCRATVVGSFIQIVTRAGSVWKGTDLGVITSRRESAPFSYPLTAPPRFAALRRRTVDLVI